MRLRRLIGSNQTGAALIEFALVLPVLVTLLIGTVEVARFGIIHQKVDKVAHSMADFVTRGATVSVANLTMFGQAVPHIMRPFAFDGTVIFSSVGRFTTANPPCPANSTCITWQRRILGAAASRVGVQGGIPALPGDYPMITGQNVIVAEAVHNFEPILEATGTLVPSLAPRVIYKAALLKPRQGTLLTIGP